jgi:hypothetical protein
MFLTSEIIQKAFLGMQKIEVSNEGKKRLEKVSALSYLVATAIMLKKIGQSELDLSVASSYRNTFKKTVEDFKKIPGTITFTDDFTNRYSDDVQGGVSANFLTTLVAGTRNSEVVKNYPSRTDDSALLDISKEKVKLNTRLIPNLNSYYNLQEIKIPLAIWLSRDHVFNIESDLSTQINTNLQRILPSNLAKSLEVDEAKLLDFGIPKSEIDKFSSNEPNISSVLNLGINELNRNTNSSGVEGLLNSFHKDVNSAGFIFGKDLLGRFIASLISKRFCILTGLAGSGKTKIAELFALWISEVPEKQIKLIAVGADWSSSESLLGYPDALDKSLYNGPSNGLLHLLDRAIKNPDQPYFLILDEMNLSHVERYFSDFLSAMESIEPELCLHGSEKLKVDDELSIEKTVKLPENLFIIGTVNVDETTYMFSPKVLDRANVIEFRVESKEISEFIIQNTTIDTMKIRGNGANFGIPFTSEVKNRDFHSNSEQAKKIRESLAADLPKLFESLYEIGAEFGFRTTREIVRFINSHSKILGNEWKYEDSLDAQIVQKLMPKLHGSARKLSPVLTAIKQFSELHNLPLTNDKATRMQKRLNRDGFTSFAEN